MYNFFDFNFTYVTIPDLDTWAAGVPPLDGLAIYTDVSKMEEGIGAGVFCQNSVI